MGKVEETKKKETLEEKMVWFFEVDRVHPNKYIEREKCQEKKSSW